MADRKTYFIPGDVGNHFVRGMNADELFDMAMFHMAAVRAGENENPQDRIDWGNLLLTRAFGMLGVPPGEVNY